MQDLEHFSEEDLQKEFSDRNLPFNKTMSKQELIEKLHESLVSKDIYKKLTLRTGSNDTEDSESDSPLRESLEKMVYHQVKELEILSAKVEKLEIQKNKWKTFMSEKKKIVNSRPNAIHFSAGGFISTSKNTISDFPDSMFYVLLATEGPDLNGFYNFNLTYDQLFPAIDFMRRKQLSKKLKYSSLDNLNYFGLLETEFSSKNCWGLNESELTHKVIKNIDTESRKNLS